MSDLLLEVLPWSLAGSARDQKLYVVTLGLLVLGSVLALLALWIERLDVLAVAVAGGGAVGWLLSSAPAEGGTLLVVLPGNGLTLADLAAAPAVLLVARHAVRRIRRSSAQGGGTLEQRTRGHQQALGQRTSSSLEKMLATRSSPSLDASPKHSLDRPSRVR